MHRISIPRIVCPECGGAVKSMVGKYFIKETKKLFSKETEYIGFKREAKKMENDYSQDEVGIIINELLGIHKAKLMVWEIGALERMQIPDKISQLERDWLIGIYDRVGEAGY